MYRPSSGQRQRPLRKRLWPTTDQMYSNRSDECANLGKGGRGLHRAFLNEKRSNRSSRSKVGGQAVRKGFIRRPRIRSYRVCCIVGRVDRLRGIVEVGAKSHWPFLSTLDLSIDLSALFRNARCRHGLPCPGWRIHPPDLNPHFRLVVGHRALAQSGIAQVWAEAAPTAQTLCGRRPIKCGFKSGG